MLAAQANDLARHQHQLAAEQVVGGHAVFQAVHAAGILRHVAADRAGDLRGRIGRIVEAGMLDRLRDGEIGHAGFDHGDAVREIDLADAVELGHAEKHAVGERQRAARQRGAGPARHHLDALGVTEGEHPAAPAQWSRAAPPPSETADRRSAHRIHRAASPAQRRSRLSPARWRAAPSTMRSRRASTA